MTPLMTMLVANAAAVLKASTIVAASAATVAVSVAKRHPNDFEAEVVASHTLTDIGLEPATLTWIR
ncbi:MAG: hypothetical protein CBC34_010185 [Hyphomicrobiaceae bacterium TMED74]|nr:hypothetical protein [Filomicrobium sp.]RPG41448.1 MAG: hypothetical protein CBC34_010185 [Hyphomicrobiaceae bacterium TMED74]